MSNQRENDELYDIEYDEWGDPVKSPKKDERKFADEWGDPKKAIRIDEETKAYASERQKIELENRLVKEGMIYPRAHYLPRGRFRGILAVLLAFVFGLFITLGTLVSVGVYIASRPLRNVLGFFTDEPGNYVSEDYLDQTTIEVANEVVEVLSKGSELTLGDLLKFSPALKDLLNKILNNAQASLGIEFSAEMREELFGVPMNKMLSYLRDDFAMGIELGKVMKLKANSDPMLLAICYGDEGIDYRVRADGSIEAPIEGGRAPATLADVIGTGEDDGITNLLYTVPLGTMMGLPNQLEGDTIPSSNAMMFALCYGTLGELDEDGNIINGTFAIKDGKIIVDMEAKNASEEFCYPTSVGDLKDDSNTVINKVELATMLGFAGEVEESYVNDNILMFSLCYGDRYIDWTYNPETKRIELLTDREPTTLGELTDDANGIIQDMEVEALMGIKFDSDKLMRYIAYGTELSKDEDTGEYIELHPYWDKDAGEQAVDEDGKPLFDKDGEPIYTGAYVYDEGDGRYKFTYETDEDGNYVLDANGEKIPNGIEMLPDPNSGDINDPDSWTLFAKRKVSDLTGSDSDLVEGMLIGDLVDIDTTQKGILTAIKDWTVRDLNDQDKIKSLKVGDILDVQKGSSSMLLLAIAGYTLGELEDEDTVTSLKLGEIIDLTGDNTSRLLKSMSDWRIKDLQNQNRIERLRLSQILHIDENSALIMQALQDWRLTDLTDQSKIDTLALGQVIDLTGATGILAALKDTQLGKLTERVDALTLYEILGNDIENNKLLKHLADSTVKTLSDDLSALTIGTAFADQVYSYMAINGNTTYQTLYENYAANHAAADYSAENYPIPEKLDIAQEEVISYRVVTGTDTRVALRYYTEENNRNSLYEASELDTDVMLDVVIRRNNRLAADGKVDSEGNPYEFATPYYYEHSTVLTAEYKYGVIDYDYHPDGNENGAPELLITDIPATDRIEMSEGDYGTYYRYNAATKTFEACEIQLDDYSYFYEYADPASLKYDDNGNLLDEPEMIRVDLEYQLISYSYTENGVTVTYMQNGDGKWANVSNEEDIIEVLTAPAVFDEDGEVLTDGYDYFVTRHALYAHYSDEANTALYAEDATTECYAYIDENGATVQLDRYMTGVWFMLFGSGGELLEDGTYSEVVFDAEKPVLEMDTMITDLNATFTDTVLWKLYFHGVMEQDPYVDLKATYTVSDREVDNLSDVKISEFVSLVRQLLG